MAFVLALNVGQSAVRAYQQALPNARVVNSGAYGMSATFTQLVHRERLATFAKRNGWDGEEPLAVVGFSAGGYAIRDWLARGDDAGIPRLAMIILDGLHGGDGPECSDAISGVVRFARDALAEPTARMLVSTSTAIEPPYASTTACNTRLVEQLGGSGDELTRAGVYILDYGGTDGDAHNAQQREVGPRIMVDYAAPFFEGRVPGGLSRPAAIGIALAIIGVAAAFVVLTVQPIRR